MIEPLALSLAFWELQAFFAPETGHFLCIDPPAFDTKQLSNLAISVIAIFFGEPDHRKTQIMIILPWVSGPVIETGPGHADRSARAPLRGGKPLAYMGYGLTKVGNRQALGFK